MPRSSTARPATAADRTALADIQIAAFLELHASFLPESVEPELVASCIHDPVDREWRQMAIAEADGQPSAMLYRNGEPPRTRRPRRRGLLRCGSRSTS